MNSSVAIPAGLTTYLRFNHAYGFEDDAGHAYDGGVLEYSTNNGASWSDLGPLLTDGGYNGTITTSSNNPLKGRNAFVRESNGYKSSRANLSSLAGQSVRIRFRIGTDFIADDYGWFIDDIRIYTCGPTLAPTAATQAASNVTTSGATLNGMVDPNGTATSYQFEFGPTAAYGSFAPAGPASVGAGSDPIAVTQTIGGLAAAATYHYRVVAVRGATRVNGADQTFTTVSPPPPPVAGSPAGLHDRRHSRKRCARRDGRRRCHLRPGRKRHDQGPRRKGHPEGRRRKRQADRRSRGRHPRRRSRC